MAPSSDKIYFRKKKDFVYLLDDVLGNFSSDIVIDFRPADRFNANIEEPVKTQYQGNIARSINIPADSLMRGTKLKAKSELKKIFSV